jgi:enamine deaminase RidA (YjgF/YER057c/UK114 family)
MANNFEWNIIQPKDVSQPLGAYSHAISVNLSNQMEQVFINLGRILESAGTNFENVVKFTTYLTRSEDLDTFYKKRLEIFSKIYPDGRYPTNTLLVIDQLARKEWLIEIEAVAALP